jgi:hypothetical protein
MRFFMIHRKGLSMISTDTRVLKAAVFQDLAALKTYFQASAISLKIFSDSGRADVLRADRIKAPIFAMT